MSMPTTDYNQQLLCYLQYWRQLLEQWTGMAVGAPFLTAPPTPPSGMQFMPPTMPFTPSMPFMPPMPMGPPTAPMPPAPGDYAQQLFSYLQAWRQHLEQTMGAGSVLQAGTAQQASTAPANGVGTSGNGRPDAPSPAGGPANSKAQSDKKDSDPVPPKVLREPTVANQTAQSEIGLNPAILGLADPRERFQMADPRILSARPEASRPTSEAPASQAVGSAFISAMNRVEPGAATPVIPRSLFSTPGGMANLQQAGETPSP